ncbi:MAG: Cellulose-binding domain protein [Myxococcales bacterium]|nr:Cellulose-binding domain protein [Myxococcales bacterium]
MEDRTSLRSATTLLVPLALSLLSACTGKISDVRAGAAGTGSAGNTGNGGSSGAAGATGVAMNVPAGLAVGASGLHRLSRIEYDNSLRDLLGDTTRPGFAKLPEDVNDPFDNDYKTQLVSGALVATAETLATDASTRLLADPARRDTVVGCKPTGPSDAKCMDTFVRAFGRRAFRRPLTTDEVAAYVGLQSFAVEAGDFYAGVDLVVRAVLQDPSFLYRVEVGVPVAGQTGVYQLDDYEIGARLSYFLWGTTPSDELLDLAATGSLATSAGRRSAATKLLADARGAERVRSFHSFWLGYHQLPVDAQLGDMLRAETDALVTRVVLEKKADYLELFRWPETFLTDAAATRYGLPAPGSATGAWVSYGANPRRGILSHGAVLATGAKFDDTSPTLRGVFVRNRLLCQVVPPPPPNVMVDQPPPATTTRCKIDRYAAHRAGGCAGCHSLTDGIGFGLENYDRTGLYRATEAAAPECAIAGAGQIVGSTAGPTGDGKFNGPAGLGELLIASGGLEGCVVTQLFRMAHGRRETSNDMPALATLTDGFKKNGRTFDTLMVDVAAADAFGYRRLETTP